MLPSTRDPQAEPQTAIDLWNREDPCSLVNLVPPEMSEKFEEAYKARPELFNLDDFELWKKLRKLGGGPSPVDNRIRLGFWMEFDQSRSENRPMETSRAYLGVTSKQTFYLKLKDPRFTAWLLTPPVSYQRAAEEGLAFGMWRMRRILDLDPIKGNKVDLKLAELQAKITKMLDERVRGAVVQKNLQLQVKTSDKEVAKAMMDSDMDRIQQRLYELRRKAGVPTEETPLVEGPGSDEEVIEAEVVSEHKAPTEENPG